MFIERAVYKELHSHIKSRQATILTGIRRSGKTTLVKKLLDDIPSDNKAYIDLDNLSNRRLFMEENYDNIVNGLSNFNIDLKKKAYVAIDEIQLLPEITSIIKYIYDNYNIKFILTGSSSYYIKNRFRESLAGRKKLFELHTLNFMEFLLFKGIEMNAKNELGSRLNTFRYEKLKKYYDEYIKYGGFPEVALTLKKSSKKEIISDILDSYIKADIKTIYDFKNFKDIYNFLNILGSRAANRIDYSKISRMTGISRPTIYNYFELFEQTYLITRVPVYSKSPDKEISKTQKVFFNDNGILNLLSVVSSGIQLENSVFNQLKHYGDLSYYMLKNGREIDFILNKKICIEVKETATSADKKRLSSLSKNLGIKKNIIISRNISPDIKEISWAGDI